VRNCFSKTQSLAARKNMRSLCERERERERERENIYMQYTDLYLLKKKKYLLISIEIVVHLSLL